MVFRAESSTMENRLSGYYDNIRRRRIQLIQDSAYLSTNRDARYIAGRGSVIYARIVSRTGGTVGPSPLSRTARIGSVKIRPFAPHFFRRQSAMAAFFAFARVGLYNAPERPIPERAANEQQPRRGGFGPTTVSSALPAVRGLRLYVIDHGRKHRLSLRRQRRPGNLPSHPEIRPRANITLTRPHIG